ncbi:unnamed protein product, partial [Ceratitis capitata]
MDEFAPVQRAFWTRRTRVDNESKGATEQQGRFESRRRNFAKEREDWRNFCFRSKPTSGCRAIEECV